MEFEANINMIIRHIKKVEDNCNLLAKKLSKENHALALKLIQLGRIHDASKFDDFEFKHLHKESPHFTAALQMHHIKNPHHPEHWQNIAQMPDEYLAEMVCDCVARAQEFGTDARIWFRDTATIKYNFSYDDETGLKIQKYLNLLLTPSFS